MQPQATTGNLPISLRSLIHARSVEDYRREFQAAWNESTRDAVVRTVCAFDNDLLNLNSGYVVIGIETGDGGQPILPPRGLEDADLDRIQREIRGQCNRINPPYQPLLFPEVYEGKPVLAVWAPGGDTRPYEAPSRGGGRAHYVRSGSETVEATGAFRSQLFEQTARGARIDVVEFPDGAGGDLIHERIIGGPIHRQIRDVMRYLESSQDVLVEKIPGRLEAKRIVKYPFDAIREAVVNAVYHRSYQIGEPTKVYIYPDRMTITSYPGPVHGIELDHFASGGAIPSVPARNRKVGELLKELRLAESRGTGLPRIRRSMAANGSPAPRFDFDAGRTYFAVTLPAHPRFGEVRARRGAL